MHLHNLIWLVNSPEQRKIYVRGKRCVISLLPALDMLCCLAEARELYKSELCKSEPHKSEPCNGSPDGGKAALALAENAVLAARCLRRFGRPVFKSPMTALKTFTPDELAYIAEQYGDMRQSTLERIYGTGSKKNGVPLSLRPPAPASHMAGPRAAGRQAAGRYAARRPAL